MNAGKEIAHGYSCAAPKGTAPSRGETLRHRGFRRDGALNTYSGMARTDRAERRGTLALTGSAFCLCGERGSVRMGDQTELLHTPLYALHREAGARMAPFG